MITLGPGDGRPHWFFGGLVVLKASAEDTNSAFSVTEQWYPRGVATPLHSQPEDFESFYVIQGQVTLFLEGQEPVEASAGSYAYVPAGLPHAFRVTSETAGVLNYTTPLHEQFFLAVADPAPSFELPPEGPPDIERLEAAAQRFGVEILGPPPGASN
jgi:quercetin dioxygenase-like cupin family protein